jgi:hypothetical protein
MCTVLTRIYIGDLNIYPIIISGVLIHFYSYSTDCIIHFDLFWNQTSHHVWHGALTRIENISLFYIDNDRQFKYPLRLNLVLLFFYIYRRKK